MRRPVLVCYFEAYLDQLFGMDSAYNRCHYNVKLDSVQIRVCGRIKVNENV